MPPRRSIITWPSALIHRCFRVGQCVTQNSNPRSSGSLRTISASMACGRSGIRCGGKGLISHAVQSPGSLSGHCSAMPCRAVDEGHWDRGSHSRQEAQNDDPSLSADCCAIACRAGHGARLRPPGRRRSNPHQFKSALPSSTATQLLAYLKPLLWINPPGVRGGPNSN